MVAGLDIDALSAWVGRTEATQDIIEPTPLRGLAALLDHAEPPWRDGTLPPLGHWLYFRPLVRQSALDCDGHPKRGEFMPPVPLPRRMWAGGRLDFVAPIRIGAPATRTSTIASVTQKIGKNGPLVFVTIRHEISADDVLAIVEEQDLVYRGEGQGGAVAGSGLPEAAAGGVEREFNPDPVQLFRYSALTFNGHRIHYDRDYARDIEGYAGLVVHGPFVATLLLDHFWRQNPGADVARFSFRALNPLLDTASFTLCSDGAKLWTRDAVGAATMQAEVELR